MKYIFLLLLFLTGCVSPDTNLEFYTDTNQEVSDNQIEVRNLSKLKPAKMRRKAINKIVRSGLSIKVPVGSGAPGDEQYLAAIGSATLIKHKNTVFILTARHVALGGDPIKHACSIVSEDCIELEPNMVFEIEMRPSLAKDFALYSVKRIPKGAVPTTISDEDPYIGDPVWVSGMPFGRHPWVSGGNIGWIFGENPNSILGVHSFAAPGSSGGGVFDRDGRLIGITVAIPFDPLLGPQVNQVLAVPIKNLWFLN